MFLFELVLIVVASAWVRHKTPDVPEPEPREAEINKFNP